MLERTLVLTIFTLILIFVAVQAFATEGFDYIPDENTLALWHFDNDDGDNIIDSSPNKFNGTVEGKADWGDEGWKKDGAVGKSFLFDGTTVINVGKIKELIRPDEITVEAWVNPSDLSGWKLICCNWGGAVVGAYHLGVEAGVPKLHITNAAGVTTFAAAVAPLNVDEWQHVAGTYDGKSIKIYVNGELANEANASGALKDNDMDVIIGSKDSREFQWKGRIDEVRISKIARDPKELSPNMTAPMAVKPANKLATTWADVKAF